MSQDNVAYSAFAPLLLGLVTIVAWFGFQTLQLIKEGENLDKLRTNQATIYANAQKMRTQLDAIASETAKLAATGNQHAALIVNALKQRGVTIDPSKAGKPPAEAPAAK